MLVENQKVVAMWHGASRRHYELLGYSFTQYKDTFIIPVEHLSVGSEIGVKVICDYCGKQNEIQWKKYYRRVIKHDTTNKYACKDCCPLKTVETSITKYGGYFNTTEQGKVRRLNGIINKYGVESVRSLEAVKQKKIERAKKNYGKDYYFQTEQFYNSGKSNIKLTNEEVINILDLKYKSNFTTNEIFERYKDKVSMGTIRGICYGRTWKHISKNYLNGDNISVK